MRKKFAVFLVIILICIPFFQVSNADILSELKGVDENTSVTPSGSSSSGTDIFTGNEEAEDEEQTGILSTIVKILYFIPAWLIQAVLAVIIWALPSITGIIYGTTATFQINYFDSSPAGITGGLVDFVSNMYTALRYLAMVIYVIMIAYLAIRMLISSIGKQKAMYKTLIKYWFTGLLLLGAGHYIMAFVIWLGNLITTLFYNIAYTEVFPIIQSAGGGDFNQIIPYFLKLSLLNGKSLETLVESNLLSLLTTLIIAIIYIGVLCAVIWTYTKRLMIVTFLMIIYPLVSVSYVFDKVGDRKAQTMQHWFHEFATNVFTQAIHSILLTLILLAMSVTPVIMDDGAVVLGPILALIMLMFIFKGEELLKQIFQINSDMGGVDFGKSGAGLLGAMHLANTGIQRASEFKKGRANHQAYTNFLSKNGLNQKSSYAAQRDAAKKMGLSEDDFNKLREDGMNGKYSTIGAFAGTGAALFALGAGGNSKSMATGFMLGDAIGKEVASSATARSENKKFDKDIDKLKKNLDKFKENIDDLPEPKRKDGESDEDFNERKDEWEKENKERADLRKEIGSKLGINSEALIGMKSDDIKKYLDEEKDIFNAETKYGANSAIVKAMKATKTLNRKKDYSDDDIWNFQFAQDDKNAYIRNISTGETTVISGKGDPEKYEGGAFSGWQAMPSSKQARDVDIDNYADNYADELMNTKYSYMTPGSSEYKKKRNNLRSDGYDKRRSMYSSLADAVNLPGFYDQSPDHVAYSAPTPKDGARMNYENAISGYMASGRTDADLNVLTNSLQSLGISLDNIKNVLSNVNTGAVPEVSALTGSVRMDYENAISGYLSSERTNVDLDVLTNNLKSLGFSSSAIQGVVSNVNSENASGILTNMLNNRDFIDSSIRAYNHENLHNPASAASSATLANVMPTLNASDRQEIENLGSKNLRFDTTMNSNGGLEVVVTSLDDPTKFTVVKPDKDKYASDFVVPTSANEVVTTAAFINDSGEVIASKGSFAKTNVAAITKDYVKNSTPQYDLSVVEKGVYSGQDEIIVVRQGNYQTVLDQKGRIIHSTKVEEDIGNAAQEVHLVRGADGSTFDVDKTKSGMLSGATMKKIQNQVTREKMGTPTTATEYYANEMIENWEESEKLYSKLNKK